MSLACYEANEKGRRQHATDGATRPRRCHQPQVELGWFEEGLRRRDCEEDRPRCVRFKIRGLEKGEGVRLQLRRPYLTGCPAHLRQQERKGSGSSAPENRGGGPRHSFPDDLEAA